MVPSDAVGGINPSAEPDTSQLLPIAPAQRQTRSVFEEKLAVSRGTRLKLFHPCHVDDCPAMHADELIWVEFRLEAVHGLTNEVHFGPDVKLRIVSRRLNPVNRTHGEKVDAP